eukprot:CAMPEP_0116066376 /NCGR_PEP_ID=MMETSP0322-20121206/10340_1 /TAXON_ID=163516 /ORGANISM="Leptocylindrus danicus var. apora, Strain B651" /LENGTH=217 /DNA_ID=CAMNT_0003552907 /DNA_START=53 /DNA_END=706 /DNA_ORIENTATION=+
MGNQVTCSVTTSACTARPSSNNFRTDDDSVNSCSSGEYKEISTHCQYGIARSPFKLNFQDDESTVDVPPKQCDTTETHDSTMAGSSSIQVPMTSRQGDVSETNLAYTVQMHKSIGSQQWTSMPMSEHSVSDLSVTFEEEDGQSLNYSVSDFTPALQFDPQCNALLKTDMILSRKIAAMTSHISDDEDEEEDHSRSSQRYRAVSKLRIHEGIEAATPV